VGKLEGSNHLKVLGIDERILLNGFARIGSSWTLDGEFCQALVKNIVNH
jgi:hypothetical protein